MSITKLFDYSEPRVAAATVFVLGAFVVAFYGGEVVRDIKLAGDTIEVTGSAKEAVVADQGRLVIHLETKTAPMDQVGGYTILEAALKQVSEHLTKEGLVEFETPAPLVFPNYTYPQYGEPIFTGYTVSRDIIVRSNDVLKLSTLAGAIEPLTGKHYTTSISMLELTYSKLAGKRVDLLSKAIADSKARAEAIAKDSGRSINTLRTASSGVVQVLPLGGVEISDYGTYDTQSMNKEIMVTVRATYSLQ